jgi:hypothetical protein
MKTEDRRKITTAMTNVLNKFKSRGYIRGPTNLETACSTLYCLALPAAAKARKAKD